MISIIRTNEFNMVDLNDPGLLTTIDMLCVECTEYHPERSNNLELQLDYGFGLTQLGGLTVRLGNEKVKNIVAFNYKVEENNQVGLCVPFNLVLVPTSFFKNVYKNNYDADVQKHIDDIIEANEKHQKRNNLYINFSHPYSNSVKYWENEVLRNNSLDKLEDILSKKVYNHTKRIYLVY